MATITGLTAARMLAIEAGSVVDGEIIAGDLILEKFDGSVINAGAVAGPQGIQGVPGEGVPVGGILGQVLTKQSGTDYDSDWDDLPVPIDVATALPTTNLVEEMRVTVLSDDHETTPGKVANDFVYLPTTDATRPWHHCGGHGWRRRFGALNGSGTSVWTNEGTIFTAPFTGYYDIELSWFETNGAGESNGSIAVGLSGGTRWNAATVFDTSSARPYRTIVSYRQLITKNDIVVVWMQISDSGNPAVAWDTRVHVIPVRGSA